MLYNPADPDNEEQTNHQAFIVAVHGLGGHMYKTWTHDNGCLWLRDCLPRDFSGCHISTFGYDSGVFSKSISHVEEFARQLLVAVARETSGVRGESSSSRTKASDHETRIRNLSSSSVIALAVL